jgi:hypothetical protein
MNDSHQRYAVQAICSESRIKCVWITEDMSEHEVKKPNRTAIGTNSMKKILKVFWMG